jgi:surface polysaccharide O-acyltransferase-like enzyme
MNIVPAQFGSLLKIQPGAAGAGAEYNFTIAIPGRFIVSAVTLSLTTSAGVFNRNLYIFLGSGIDDWCRIHTSGFSHTASATVTYYFYNDALYAGNVINGFCTNPFPLNLMLSGALSFRTLTGNLQVADELDKLIIWGLRWLEPTD